MSLDFAQTLCKVNLTSQSVGKLPAPQNQLENVPAHRIRSWLDKVKIELKRERNKGKFGHHRYDMNRHIALAAARNALALRLKELEKNSGANGRRV